ncbi:MAG: YbjN domain-containing protein [Saprospiraceae bacterium]|nr:YbjN domain-containing protein [Saprospiraceae bacterium]
MDLSNYYTIVEEAIAKIGLNPVAQRAVDLNTQEVKQGQWNLQKQDQAIWIDVWYPEREKRGYFQVIAPLLEVPSNISPLFYRDVLEANNELFGVAFAITRNQLIIKVIREAEGMDANEAYNMIMRIGSYATTYRPKFVEKYYNGNEPGAAPNL